MAETTSPGRLYVCATPIGNLEDVSFRLLRVLREVSVVAAEDTRQAKKLLGHYGITAQVVSLHEHNEARRAPKLLARILAGESVAVVSDAGMPAISDPGTCLVRAAAEHGVDVTVIPGPSALVTALAGSGLPAQRFAFEGFLPHKPRRRRARLEALKDDERTLVFFEAPHRLKETLADMRDILGDRQACVARELTKLHEEWQRGPLAQLAEAWNVREPLGEYVIVVAGAKDRGDRDDGPPRGPSDAEGLQDVARRVAEHMSRGLDKKEAVRAVALETGISRRTVYRAALNLSAREDRERGSDVPNDNDSGP
ncbi:MAG: 16S rRNA (cytidine(1402)-2'-O)-methyltransferase [Firmicutes bacterium]|nr:16S rRNA (cytidine(1402)-2'-O)-methyltransferase [Bacillota bacterium]